MRSRLQIIFILVAVLLFATTFIIDISNFGRDRTNLRENIDLRNIVTIVLVNIIAGLILGLLFFRKRTYKQRLLLTVPIAFILFSIADVGKVTIHEYGLFDQ